MTSLGWYAAGALWALGCIMARSIVEDVERRWGRRGRRFARGVVIASWPIVMVGMLAILSYDKARGRA